MKDGKRNNAYKSLRRLGTDEEESEFHIPGIDDEKFTTQEKAEVIANHFASISSKVMPLKIEELPPKVKEALQDDSEGPVLSDYEVYMKLKKAKKPHSYVKEICQGRLFRNFPLNMLFL